MKLAMALAQRENDSGAGMVAHSEVGSGVGVK